MNSEKKACIVLPTYNERENVSIILPQIFEQARKIKTHDLYVLVVDDSSPDGTADEVKKLQQKFEKLMLLSGEKKGLGDAYKRGMKKAIELIKPELIFEMDADSQHSPELIPLFVSLANYGFDIVIGSRFVLGGSTPDFSLRRKLISKCGNFLLRVFGGMPPIRDCTSGFRCIRTSILKSCDLSFLSTKGYSFQSSLLFELLRKSSKVVEIPIIFRDRKIGKSKLTLSDQIEFLLNIPRLRFQKSNEFIRYCLVGISGAFVNIGLYLLLNRIFYIKFEIASIIAIELSILYNFFLYNLLKIQGQRLFSSLTSQFVKFHYTAAVGGIVNYITLIVLVKVFNLFDIISYLIGIIIGGLFTYMLKSGESWKKVKSTLLVS